jgi:hypothetical protein
MAYSWLIWRSVKVDHFGLIHQCEAANVVSNALTPGAAGILRQAQPAVAAAPTSTGAAASHRRGRYITAWKDARLPADVCVRNETLWISLERMKLRHFFATF